MQQLLCEKIQHYYMKSGHEKRFGVDDEEVSVGLARSLAPFN